MSTAAPETRRSTIHKLIDVLEGFEDAMLMTTSEMRPGRLHGRPMRIAAVEPDGSLWFFASSRSEKVAETLEEAEAHVVCQASDKQVMLHGTIGICRDAQRIAKLWSKPFEEWFPAGLNDPALLLLHFVPVDGEYWDHTGMRAARYYLDPENACFTGEPPPESCQRGILSARSY